MLIDYHKIESENRDGLISAQLSTYQCVRIHARDVRGSSFEKNIVI